jgi:excisionase family DNA binding protein
LLISKNKKQMSEIVNPFELLDKRLTRIESKIDSLTNQSSPPPLSEIGSISLATDITGLARQTIYQLVSARDIPFMKKGKKLYFSRTELTDWIKSGKRDTIEVLTEKASEEMSDRLSRRTKL